MQLREQESEDLVVRLHSALSHLDRPEVVALSERLTALTRASQASLSDAAMKKVLAGLRQHRFFPQMQRVAEAFIQVGHDAPVVRRQYAQGLIEQGALVAAIAVLRGLVADLPLGSGEGDEARGLLGRAFKQQYVSAGRPASPQLRAALGAAVHWYSEPFVAQPAVNYWHGINAVACLARARRDGVDVTRWTLPAVDERRSAAEILQRLTDRLSTAPAPAAYEVATALEACVALDDLPAARALAEQYAAHPCADAFELASTVRQLTEVWELDESDDGMGRAILPTLRAALLSRTQGQVELSAAEVVAGSAQQGLSHGGMYSLGWYQDGLRRARLVGRICMSRYPGIGIGTGFLVPGEVLAETLQGRWLLMTNAHVVSVDDCGRMMPDEAVVTFEALAADGGKPKQFRVAPSPVWQSGCLQLDTAVLALTEPVDGLTDTDRCQRAEQIPAKEREDRVYIIGHPKGGGLTFSLQDNLFLDHRDAKLHYRTPTEVGNSGSPLFDASWNLLGIHHAGSETMRRLDGSGTYPAKEGITLHAIRAQIATDGVHLPS